MKLGFVTKILYYLEEEIFGQGNGSISNLCEDMVSEKEGTNFLIKLKELAILYVKSGDFMIFPTHALVLHFLPEDSASRLPRCIDTAPASSP